MVKLKKSKLAKGRKGKAMKIFFLILPYNYLSSNFKRVFLGEPEKGIFGRGTLALFTLADEPLSDKPVDAILFGGGFKLEGEQKSQSMLEFDVLYKYAKDCNGSLARRLSKKAILDVDKRNYNTAKIAVWFKAAVLGRLEKTDEKFKLFIFVDPAHERGSIEINKAFSDLVRVGRCYVQVFYSNVPYEDGDVIGIEPPLAKIIGLEVKKLIAENKSKATMATVGRVEPKN